MKRTSLVSALLLIMLFSAGGASAQYKYDYRTDNEELYVSEGMVTVEQINGWAGKGGLSGYVSMPSALSGAVFATYRHFFTKRFALGFTAGLDNESGDLSYGNPEITPTGLEGTSGHYSVHTKSFALEALLAYFKRPKIMLYGYVGAGATMYEDLFTINPNAPWGSPVPLPSNPYDYHTTYFNAQVTPFGVRFGGNIAGFAEVGFGYKGLFSGGLSVRF